MNTSEVTIEPPSRKPRRRAQEGEVLSIEMTKTCARDLTDRIKAAVDDVAEMLYRAHQERAWAALGYESWKAYCTAEFAMSERHSYRLLDFVEIKNVLTDPGVSPTSEKQVRALARLEPDQQPVAWKRAVEIAEGEQPTAKEVEEAVVEMSKGPFPIPIVRTISPEVIAAGQEAAKDSDALWNLKNAWKKTGKKDRSRFLAWVVRVWPDSTASQK